MEHTQIRDLVRQPCDLLGAVRILYADKQHISDADPLWFEGGIPFAGEFINHIHGPVADFLKHNTHASFIPHSSSW